MKLPWIMGYRPLQANYQVSCSRLKGQVTRSRETPDIVESYNGIINEQLGSNIIQEVPELERAEKVCYLPHQAEVHRDNNG